MSKQNRDVESDQSGIDQTTENEGQKRRGETLRYFMCGRHTATGEDRRQLERPTIETWVYEEVINRLRRAAGLVAKNVIDLPRLDYSLTQELSASVLDEAVLSCMAPGSSGCW